MTASEHPTGRRVLIADCNINLDSWGSADIRDHAKLAPHLTFHTRRAPQSDLPKTLAGFDALIVSGSKTSCLAREPWINPLLDLIREALADKKPLLGLCFGHQMMARAIGGVGLLRQADRGEIGWSLIEQRQEHPLMKDLPQKFFSFSSHSEEVVEAPKGFNATAGSERCAIQAMSSSQGPAFGLQFHPERDAARAQASILKAAALKESKPNLLRHREKRYDPRVGEAIFKAFFTWVR